MGKERNAFLRRGINLLLIVCLLLASFTAAVPSVAADTETDSVLLTVIGDVYTDPIFATNSLPITAGETALDVLRRGVGEENVVTENSEYGEMITEIAGVAGTDDYSYWWAFIVNGAEAAVGADAYQVKNNDHVCFKYASWPVDITGCEGDAGEPEPGEEKEPPVVESIAQIIKEVSRKILDSGIETDWEAIGLALAGQEVPASYLAQLKQKVIDKQGDLGAATEYARTALAIRALGGNPQDVGGYDLIEQVYDHPELTSFVNSTIYSLLALDSDNYQVPTDKHWVKEKLVEELLAEQNGDGGWSFVGSTSDPDLTGMALSALAPYTKQAEVETAINKAIAWLTGQQTDSGGFIAFGQESSESVSQVIIGLTANGIDPAGQEFTKEKGNAVSNLISFYAGSGIFPGEWGHQYPTQEALLALNAYQYFLDGHGSIYDLSHIEIREDQGSGGSPNPGPNPSHPGEETGGKVYLAVNGLNGRALVARTEVSLRENDTPFSILLRELGESQVTWRGSGRNIYVQSIKGLAEFDHGPQSGWNYSVNGIFPSGSAGGYRLQAGDEVRWLYTANLGADVGAGGGIALNPSAQLSTVSKEIAEKLKELELSLAVDNKQPLQPGQQTVLVLHAQERMDVKASLALKERLDQNNVNLEQVIEHVDQAYVLRDEEDELILEIPAYALEERKQITIREEQSEEEQTELISSLYQFLPKGTNFEQPIYISIKIPLLIDHLEDVALVWLDEESNQWIPVPAVLDARNAVITGKVNHFTKFAVIDRSKLSLDDQHAELQQLVKDAILAVQQEQWVSGEYSFWELLALYHTNSLSAGGFLAHLEQQLEENNGQFRKVTDLAAAVTGLALIGSPADDVHGYNLLEKIYNHPNLSLQGTNGVIFSLIALQLLEAEIPDDALWTEDKLIHWLISHQLENGSWALGTEESTGSVDITAMAIGALAPYSERSNAELAIDRAVEWLAAEQLNHGGFRYTSNLPESSESLAQVIIGLAVNNIDPVKEPFAKEIGNPITRLLSFQQEDGGFVHHQGEEVDQMATQQALTALLAYNMFLKGEGSLYQVDQQSMTTLEPDTSSLPYIDQDQISAWALGAVKTAYEQQIMAGTEENPSLFAPKERVTAAQFIALLGHLLGEEAGDLAGQAVEDVHQELARQEMASMLTKALSLPASTINTNIQDVALDDPTLPNISAVFAEGLMLGDGNGYFYPSELVTREMAAVVIVRVLEKGNLLEQGD